jgi:putative transcriptional regulator
MLVQNRLNELLADKMQRERRAISMSEVAKACGMSRQNIHRWINNRVKSCPFDTMAAFCLYFECTPNDLFVVKRGDVAQ